MGLLFFWASILAIPCAISYRAGGMPLPCRSWMRDWIIPPLCCVYMVIFFKFPPGIPFWQIFLVHFFSIGLMGGMLTTYWDWLFGNVDNFYMHGAMIGLAYSPYALIAGCWIQLIIRLILLGLFMGGLNWYVNKYKIPFRDWIEELSRGAVIALSLPILMWGCL